MLDAAVRLSGERGQAVRGSLLRLGDDGELELRRSVPPRDDAWAAPELGDPSVPDADPRVLVYAAGALGYELLTLQPFSARAERELPAGGLGAVVRRAVSDHPGDRYQNLDELARALEHVTARPDSAEQRLVIAAIASAAPRTTPSRVKPVPEATPFARVTLTKIAGLTDPAAGEQRRARENAQAVLATSWDPIPTPRPSAPPPVPDLAADAVADGEARSWLRGLAEQVDQLHGRVEAMNALFERTLRQVDDSSARHDDLRATLERERRQRGEEHSVLGARLESLTRLGARLDLLEEGQRSREKIAPSPALEPVAEPSRRPLLFAAAGGAGAGALAALLVMALATPRPRGEPEAVQVAKAARAAPEAAASVAAAALPVVSSSAAPAVSPREAVKPVEPVKIAQVPPEAPAVAPARRSTPIVRKVAFASGAPAAARGAQNAHRESVSEGVRKAALDAAARGERALRAFDTSRALIEFQNALRLDPSFAAPHRGLGTVYAVLGDPGSSRREYGEYLRLAPGAADAEQIRAQLGR